MAGLVFDENLASIFGYLAADGYVVRNPPEQPHKYYKVGLRNTNNVLLKDFSDKFYSYFNKKPRLTEDRCEIGSKDIHAKLTNGFSFYSKDWNMPNFNDKNLLARWLRAYFDCDGSVTNIPGKNRKIELNSINQNGIKQIQKVLNDFYAIKSKIKFREQRGIWVLEIFGKDNLIKFKDNIYFLHPKKKNRLSEAIDSYIDYNWSIPKGKKVIEFVKNKGRYSKVRGQIRLCSIIRQNLLTIKKELAKLHIDSNLNGPSVNNYGSEYYYLSIRADYIFGD
jgi:hypothetical protein